MIEVEVGISESSDEEARAFYMRAIAELVTLDGVFDVDFWGEIRQGPVFFGVSVRERPLNAAIAVGLGAIRTAIHVAGGSTPDWPGFDNFEPEPDGLGKWVVNFKKTTQEPLEPQLV